MSLGDWAGGRTGLKRLVKRTAGWAAVLDDVCGLERSTSAACVLVYHRVAPLRSTHPQLDDWNVPPELFDRQVRALVDIADVVPLADLRRRLAEPGPRRRPLAAITIDDGYACVRTQVLPILQRYAAPATAFLVTGAVGSSAPFAFDRWAAQQAASEDDDAWRPLNWREIDECVHSGLLTFGSHSHSHRDARRCSPSELREEVDEARWILQSRLGEPHADAFAYPYGSSRLGHVNDAYVEAVRAAGHTLALTTDLGLVTGGDDPLRWPRLEAHIHDSRAVLRAKTRGAIAPYRVTDWLRQAERAG